MIICCFPLAPEARCLKNQNEQISASAVIKSYKKFFFVRAVSQSLSVSRKKTLWHTGYCCLNVP